MPANRVVNAEVNLVEYDVVGQDGLTPFIRHIGLSAAKGQHARSGVPVHDMGPPLRLSDKMQVDVTATAALDYNELRKIESFIEIHRGEHETQQLRSKDGQLRGYCVYPHARPEPEGAGDDTCIYMRFSCAGFVIEAYRFARILLIDVTKIPPVSYDAVEQAYPAEMRAVRRVDIATRKSLGLGELFPLPIIFCGYVINALNRDREDILAKQYQPTVADAMFP